MSGGAQDTDCETCNTSPPNWSRLWDKEALGATHVSCPDGFCDGYEIFQLAPNDPDRVVHSRTEMERVYKKKGLDPDTGRLVEKT